MTLIEHLNAIDEKLGDWAALQMLDGKDDEYIVAFLRVAVANLQYQRDKQPMKSRPPRPKPSDASIARAVARMAKDVIKASK